jgi:hypothetical protein
MSRVPVNHEVTWVEVCFCREPLAEERPYWEEYFELLSRSDAHGLHRVSLWISRARNVTGVIVVIIGGGFKVQAQDLVRVCARAERESQDRQNKYSAHL